jgi:4-carboxymuconolactone decarboxylase
MRMKSCLPTWRAEVYAGRMRKLVVAAMIAGFATIALAQSDKKSAPASGAAALPADIDPQSYSRLPLIKRDDLDESGKKIYDAVAAPNKTAPATGPVAVSLYSPKVAEAMRLLNDYLRFGGVLGRRNTEVAILVAAREFDQVYEWSGHEQAALTNGVDPSVINVIRNGKDVTGLSEKDGVIIRCGRELLRDHKLSSDLYAKAVELFGKQGMVEMAAVMGDYAMAAIMLSAADQHLPPDRKVFPLPPTR